MARETVQGPGGAQLLALYRIARLLGKCSRVGNAPFGMWAVGSSMPVKLVTVEVGEGILV